MSGDHILSGDGASPASDRSGNLAYEHGGSGGVRTILVLGGGGLKGLAHIGVWRALAERGIRPDAIIGTSIGALIGTLAAAGMDTEAMTERALALREEDILNINRRIAWIRGIKQTALYEADHFRDYIRDVLPVERFGQLSRPLRMNAVSLNSGDEVWFGAGAHTDIPIADAVYASCALPVYFPPLPVGGDYLADGGLIRSMAVPEAREWGAERVIAVDVSASFKRSSAEAWLDHGIVGVHQRVMEVLAEKERRLAAAAEAAGAARADGARSVDGGVMIVRPDVSHLRTFEFGHAEYAMAEGYRACKELLDSQLVMAETSRTGDWVMPRVRDLAQRTRRWVAGHTSGGTEQD